MNILIKLFMNLLIVYHFASTVYLNMKVFFSYYPAINPVQLFSTAAAESG